MRKRLRQGKMLKTKLKNSQAKAKRKVGPVKVAGNDGAVKDESKETREKV